MEKSDQLMKVEAIVRKEKFPEVDNALKDVGISGLTVFDVEGRGRAKGTEMVSGRGAATYQRDYVERAKLEIIVKESEAQKVVDAIMKAAKTGEFGDGKVLVLAIEEAWDITTGSSDSSSV